MKVTDAEQRIAAVAAKQHSLFTRAQAIDAGFTADTIRRRVRSGLWERVGRHVYRLPGAANTWEQRLMASVLEAGSGAVASHSSAAALLKVPGFPRRPIHVTQRRGTHHRLTSGTLHETFWLPPHHTTRIRGIPCSSIARCIFELAGTENPKRVARALNNARSQLGLSLASGAEVVATMGRSGVSGTTLMRKLLAQWNPGEAPPASELEDLFLSVLDAYGVPQPVRQLNAGGEAWIGRVDFAYREAKLLIECDSRSYHTAVLDWQDDIDRRAELVAAGWRIMQVTWYQLMHEPEKVVRRIRTALRHAAAA